MDSEINWIGSGFWILFWFGKHLAWVWIGFGIGSGVKVDSGFEMDSEWILDLEWMLDLEWSGFWIGSEWILFSVGNGFGLDSGLGNI